MNADQILSTTFALAVFFLFSFLFYLRCLPEMASIKSVGASFAEDNGPRHAVTLEAELPQTSASASGKQMVRLGPAKARRTEPNPGTSSLLGKSF